MGFHQPITNHAPSNSELFEWMLEPKVVFIQHIHNCHGLPGNGRMKMAKACRECRISKRKCTRVDTCGPCAQCLKSGLSCSSMLRMTKDPHLVPCDLGARFDQEDPHTINLQDEIAIELVEHYIDKIQDRPQSLFHTPTLRESVRKRTIKKPLLLAICSLGSRFSTRAEIRALEYKLTTEAKRLILADLENICLENIQTCILVANLCAANATPSSEALFFRKLPHTHSSESELIPR